MVAALGFLAVKKGKPETRSVVRTCFVAKTWPEDDKQRLPSTKAAHTPKLHLTCCILATRWHCFQCSTAEVLVSMPRHRLVGVGSESLNLRLGCDSW